jgi:hypothetical protein
MEGNADRGGHQAGWRKSWIPMCDLEKLADEIRSDPAWRFACLWMIFASCSCIPAAVSFP